MTIDPEEPLARAAVEAIHAGDLEGLRRLLDEHPGLATARIGGDRPGGTTRSLLHVATDWPGHFPNMAATTSRRPSVSPAWMAPTAALARASAGR